MIVFASRNAGMETMQAGDARTAQLAIAERIPDLILLDWMLPGTSGLELARRLRKEETSRDILIIMLTARGEEMDRVNGLDAGSGSWIRWLFRQTIFHARTDRTYQCSTAAQPGRRRYRRG